MNKKNDDNSRNWLADLEGEAVDERAYGEDLAIVMGSQAIAKAMEIAGLSRAALAERLDCHKSFVTRVLSGPQNVTLTTLGSFLWACGFEIGNIELAPIGGHGYVASATTLEAAVSAGIDFDLGSLLIPHCADEAVAASHNLALAA